MAERPVKLTIEVMPAVQRWLDKHPEERDCVERFVGHMVEELYANDGKGNRPCWLEMDRKEALAEVHWHAAKLAVRAKDMDQIADEEGRDVALTSEDAGEVREYAADVANCALMVLDVMQLLAPHSKAPANPSDSSGGAESR